ncbi:MAG: hypothetical protein F6K47_31680 [Symploca sp. SIO2E6]|nr:hypothetical protein [Symploca sp. SIO2E6]
MQEYAKRIEVLINQQQSLPTEEWQRFGEVLQNLAATGDLDIGSLAGECFYLGKNYQQAVQSWEQYQATDKPHYLLAKAEVLGMPEGLAYLKQAQEYQRMIAEWQQAGKPRQLQWLEAIAPAYEAQKDYMSAFIVYSLLDNLTKTKACFELASQPQPQSKPLTILLKYYLSHQHWQEAIAAVETYLPILTSPEGEQIGLKYYFVYELAFSQLTPEAITKPQRQRYQQFLKTHILANPRWQRYLLIEQLGIALEKIGSFVDTLEFYERYISGNYPQILQQFARDRWLATKIKQQDYWHKQHNKDKAAKISAQITAKAQAWGRVRDGISLEPPVVSRNRPTKILPQAAILPKITGLPPGIKIEIVTSDIVKFQIRHLIIKVMKSTQQVLITDVLSEGKIRVDGSSRQLQIGSVTVMAHGGESLSFREEGSGYHGVLVCEGKLTRLELDIQNMPEKILIDF